MSYIALARKWRPRTFAQLVGQEHINKSLIKSLKQQRLHHAYLFTGTRGVGKTSVARLLAKALNCEQGISAEPCLECAACTAVEQGRFIDLIEIDGASKTRVEDTREILENVQYAPTSGRFKIYLIDEVHMLSQHSFNALLKTLEEPPSHVKFLLATTDPQKLPITVLSRCLQFNLKPLQENIISTHLQQILEDENIAFEKAALDILAKAARGSMRDALSLLDQAIAASERGLDASIVKSILGHTQHDYALQLLKALVNMSPQNLLAISKQIVDEGGNFQYVLHELLSYLHQICLTQHIQGNEFISPSSEIAHLGQTLTPEDTQLLYQIAVKGLEELHLAPTPAIGFEMTLLRMFTFKPARKMTTPPPLAYQVQEKHPAREVKLANFHSEMRQKSTEEREPAASIYAVNDNKESHPVGTKEVASCESENWSEVLSKLALSGLALNAAENAEFIGKTEQGITLRIDSNHQSLFTGSVVKRIEEALSTYYKGKIKLNLRSDAAVNSSPAQQKQLSKQKQYQEAETALQNDPFFNQLQQEFSAELVKNSIAPLQDDL
ncbi:DNA polymerase III subunit gamma/tau [Legionella septentrionalis]|uniref:DNA polymerase III subunit gamma/tau n=1 Tax=Legionella septentrionalis TaxID=2498109 RepID=A0A433JIS6_9GAMM|nr:DNA polymerase III subunit gamma/tau [Legionella septentrionalis]RUQ85245.1 DNA polymerase III subunit gamma/tau [Legionella septentrionalis]